ncbi:19902_t:CDS:2, partial [Rhizophagus irregularis]
LTFARVFTNNESVDAYQNMFAAVFSVVKEDTNSEICFYHIDGKGIGCILVDAHSLLIKYQTKSKIPTEIKKMMYAIPHFETKAKVLNVLEQIKLIQNKQAIGN